MVRRDFFFLVSVVFLFLLFLYCYYYYYYYYYSAYNLFRTEAFFFLVRTLRIEFVSLAFMTEQCYIHTLISYLFCSLFKEPSCRLIPRHPRSFFFLFLRRLLFRLSLFSSFSLFLSLILCSFLLLISSAPISNNKKNREQTK